MSEKTKMPKKKTYKGHILEIQCNCVGEFRKEMSKLFEKLTKEVDDRILRYDRSLTNIRSSSAEEYKLLQDTNKRIALLEHDIKINMPLFSTVYAILLKKGYIQSVD